MSSPELLPGLARAAVRRSRAGSAPTVPEVPPLAEVDPVARIFVDVPLAHLDRPFDYAVPATMADEAVPGARVSVRFAGRVVGGFVLDRRSDSEHQTRLSPVRRVVSPEPVLGPRIAELTGRVAARYAGTRADVLRLAVPPRHAATEQRASPPGVEPPPWDREAALRAWRGHEPAAAFLEHLASGHAPRAAWNAAPAAPWPELLSYAAAATYSSGRGVLLVVPGARELALLDAALERVLGAGHHVTLSAEQGPSARYRAFLAVSRGARRVVAGTRSAAFAPVDRLGLVALWDDGDDLLAEPRAPYPHARETLLLRAEQESTAVLVGGFARTVEVDQLVRSGWAQSIQPSRALVRERISVSVTGASDRDRARDPWATSSRVPRTAHDALRRGLETGPVLVQTPRLGYVPSLACERCREPARCPACTGPLQLAGPRAPPTCRWCGQAQAPWTCQACGHHGLRAPVVGELRTAEELGRALPGVRIRTSGGARVLSGVPDEPAVVVATPGAEPPAAGGYAAVVLLDTWLTLGRADLRVAEEALRRWLGAAALVAPGGVVVAVGDPAHPALQALVRWDPAGFAARESGERRAARLPPASRLATVSGSVGAVDDALTLLSPPPGTEVLGPVPVGADGDVRAVVRAPRRHASALSAALGEVQRRRSARKLEPVRIQVDPVALP